MDGSADWVFLAASPRSGTGDFYVARYPVQHDGQLWRPSWQAAIAYCNARSQQQHLPPAYDLTSGRLLTPSGEFAQHCTEVAGYRLPSEEEWDWAARQGPPGWGFEARHKQHCRIPGLDFPTSAQEADWFAHGYARVDELIPNGADLYGLLGYAREWCSGCDTWQATCNRCCHWEEYYTNYNNDIGYQVRSRCQADDARYPFRLVLGAKVAGQPPTRP